MCGLPGVCESLLRRFSLPFASTDIVGHGPEDPSCFGETFFLASAVRFSVSCTDVVGHDSGFHSLRGSPALAVLFFVSSTDVVGHDSESLSSFGEIYSSFLSLCILCVWRRPVR